MKTVTKSAILPIFIGAFLGINVSWFDHSWAEEHNHKEHDHKEEGHEESHDESHGESHEEDSGANVGPEKGIVAVSEQNGFQLSSEAIKTFGIQSEKIKSTNGFLISSTAVVYSGESIGVFRLRKGFFKRVPVEISKQPGNRVEIRSTGKSAGFQAGDEVVVQGAPFLRIAELDAMGGIAHGHSH